MPGTNWYGILDDYKYSQNALRQLAIFIVVWSIVLGSLSMNNSIDKHNNVYRQLHSTPDYSKHELSPQHSAHPVDGSMMDVPSQYWTMDWVMSPMHTKDTVPWLSMPVSNTLCQHDGTACAPALWQTSLTCNTSYSAAQLPQTIKDEQPYIYRNTRTKWRNISPTFTCMAEKIGLYTLWLNNEHSWSLASTHNVNVLVTAIYVLFAIIALSLFLGYYHADNKVQQTQYNKYILVGFVAIYIFVSYFWTTSVALDSDKNLHRPIGTASYFYSTLSIVAALAVFTSSGIYEDNKAEAADEAEMMAMNSRTLVSTRPMSNSMNVAGFVKEETKIGARIKMPSPETSTLTAKHVCDCLNRPVHSNFVYGQLFTLPLLLLALCIHGRNYGIDTQTQIVFVTSMAVVLLDCFLYRMWWAFNMHKSVISAVGEQMEYTCLQIVTLVCMLFQVMIFIFYIVCELFHKDLRWFFITYLVLTTVVKLIALQAIHDNSVTGAYHVTGNKFSFSSSKARMFTADIYLFVLYVVGVSVVTWIYVIHENLQFQPSWMPVDNLPVQWGPGWQTFNSFSA